MENICTLTLYILTIDLTLFIANGLNLKYKLNINTDFAIFLFLFLDLIKTEKKLGTYVKKVVFLPLRTSCSVAGSFKIFRLSAELLSSDAPDEW